MVRRPAGKVTESSVAAQKAREAMAVTGRPSMAAGITRSPPEVPLRR